MNKKVVIVIVIITILVLVLGAVGIWVSSINIREKGLKGLISYFKGEEKVQLVDDWQFASASQGDSVVYSGTVYEAATAGVSNKSAVDNTLGFSTGGAKNIENFRENIKNGYFPISTDITYNGLFYDYYFNTGDAKNTSNELFSPAYSTAISKDPVSGKPEYYMTVGLNSNIKESDFQRKKLNLVIVMDISGSMSSKFNAYYYDGDNKKVSGEENKSKMEIANESLNLLLDQLKPDDKFGIVLFDDQAYLGKPVSKVSETDMNAIKNHVLEIEACGGTNFEAGYSEGTKLFSEAMLNDQEYENRIIVITDAMPNLGQTSRGELTKYVKENADNKIYTTFVGVGVDFNTEVIETLSDVKGSNYYSVHSSEEFKKIMGEDFDYMVTPLVFDLELKLNSTDFVIESVYGTDTKEKNSATLMKVNTLFPSSRNENGEAKGGVVLLKLSPAIVDFAEDPGFDGTQITVSYKDRNGVEHKNNQKVEFKTEYINDGIEITPGPIEKYDNTGIRKAIALTRYVNLMKNWILYERGEENRTMLITVNTGIKDCEYCTPEQVRVLLGENERSSVKLTVSDEYSEIFKNFKKYFEKEMNEIGDENMKQEIDILNMLIKQ